jgi:chromatin structure-remodeling complex subunit RSC1/2
LTPQATPQAAYNSHYASTSALPTTSLPVTQTANPLTAYENYRTATTSTTHRSSLPITSSSGGNAYNPPRPPEVYHLSDSANLSIPYDIRAQFHRDEHDRVLFFTSPPMDVSLVPEPAKKTLRHSIKYLAAKARERNAAASSQSGTDSSATKADASHLKRKSHEPESGSEDIKRLRERALEVLGSQIQEGTQEMYRKTYGDGWKEILAVEQEKLRVVQEMEMAKRVEMDRRERERAEQRSIKLGYGGL